jgi:hypothetical protein
MGGMVRLAPFGTEDGPTPYLVWVDPNSVGQHCKVETAATERGLRSAAKRLNFTVSENLGSTE